MNVDEIITRLTEADSEGTAYVIARTIPLKMLRKVADQMYIETDGHGADWIRKAVIKEARA
jgi:hypothetical protein